MQPLMMESMEYVEFYDNLIPNAAAFLHSRISLSGCRVGSRWHRYLATVANLCSCRGLASPRANLLKISNNLFTFEHLAKYNMLSVKMRSWAKCNKELASVCIGPSANACKCI
jgi:hypothetical protein